MPRSLSPHEHDLAARAVETLCQEPDKGLIGGCVYRGRGHLDPELIAQWLRNLIARGARLELYEQQNAIRFAAQKIRATHYNCLLVEFRMRLTLTIQHAMSNFFSFGFTTHKVFPFFSLAGWLLLLSGCASDSKQGAPTPASSTAVEKPAPVTAPQPAPAPAKASTDDKLKQAAAKPAAPFAGEGWQSLFDGESLKGWTETKFAGRGEVQVESGLLVLNMGDPFTGVNYTNEFPKMGYEIALDAMRLTGSDFFCGLTVPVGDSFCSLIVGGWGGSLFGISSLDGMDASENETTKYVSFEQGRWYRIRLRITDGRIEGWIDEEKLINVVTKDRKISLRPGEIEMSKPMGIASWQTTGVLREIKLRRVDAPDGPAKKY
jgi:Domain of Unknown Function (DUF1080)